MPLESFGSILTFAAQMEGLDREFYQAAAANPACAGLGETFEQFARDAQKNEATALRTRRENVTEMILEPIKDFTRRPFLARREGAQSGDRPEVLATAKALEAKAVGFYDQAAEKIKALPEVARALKMMGKKRRDHLAKLAGL